MLLLSLVVLLPDAQREVGVVGKGLDLVSNWGLEAVRLYLKAGDTLVVKLTLYRRY